MDDEFEHLRECLSGSQFHQSGTASFTESCYRRLCRVMRQNGEYAPGSADLAVLTRHALRREQEKQSGVSPVLAVPKRAPWPRSAEWDHFGMDVVSETTHSVHLRARPWLPDWLPHVDHYPVDGPATAEELRREYGEPLSGDPFLQPFGPWSDYRCAGQREAVRAILTAPPGSTLAVNLPTGAGKSLCAYISALTNPTGLSVVVVPTTALALDQERALTPYIPHPTAYHGGGSGGTEERNLAIRERVRAGTQRILFTAPESLVQSLAGPLYTAATHGSLRLLAVDEAHIIDQWGVNFRPEFQELAGLRQDLLRQSTGAPFTTLLLTGTMTEACLDTLETLFGKPGPFATLSAVQLRPEPSYWLASCADETIRQQRVFEAVFHLPRPLILYVTKVADAQRWLTKFRSAGFRRIALVTGASQVHERAEVVRAWQEEDLDVVVATSAFGLGMDKGDVRAVIHACVPEHIDRFYQEVGRGGRDGRACVSLLLHTREDRKTAQRLNRKSILKTVKGYDRWEAMFRARDTLPDGRIRVPVEVIPRYRFGEIRKSKRNMAWNVHTLALLARSGVIDLDAQPPPRRDQFLSDGGAVDEEQFQRECDLHHHQRVLRIIDEAHLDWEETWGGTVKRSRSRSVRSTRRGFELMATVLGEARCFAEIFAEAYEIPLRKDPPRAASLVSKSCGGCPACRRQGLLPRIGVMPTPRPVWIGLRAALPGDLGWLLGVTQQAVLFDHLMGRAAGSDRQRRERLFRFLIAKGVRSILAPVDELERLRPLLPPPPSPVVFFDEEWKPLHLPPVPALIVRPQTMVLTAILCSTGHRKDGETPRILWLPADTRDPEKPHCLLAQTIRLTSYTVEEFCTRIGV